MVEILKRLSDIQDEESECSCIDGSDQRFEFNEETKPVDLQRKLDEAIKRATATSSGDATPRSTAKDTESVLRKEMALFMSGGRRRSLLTNVYSYLQTVLPTSVEAERAFSSDTSIWTKVCSRLEGNTLDALCFLRAYFSQRGLQ